MSSIPPTKLADPPRLGQTIAGRYRLLEQVGRGGMGRVYKAEHVGLGRIVAIKVLEPVDDVPYADERFLREAKVTANLQHPNIVDVVDFGQTDQGSAYLVMEYLDGRDLGTILETDGPMPWVRARAYLSQLCAGLAAAHNAGLVHRDLKLENCIVVSGDVVKVVDFGIAKSMNSNATALTGAGALIGTPEYMSPEQARGLEVDERADVYAAGVIAYELLTGTSPFTGSAFMEVVMKQIYDPVPLPSSRNPLVPAAVDRLILKALEKNRDERFADMRAFAAAMDGVDPTSPVPASYSVPISVGVPSSGPHPVSTGPHPTVPRSQVAWTVAATAVAVSLVVGASAWAWWSKQSVPQAPTEVADDR